MPLRKRLGLAAASAVAVAVVASAIVCYVVVRTQLLDQVDGALKAQAIAVQDGLAKLLREHQAAVELQLLAVPATS